jgi:hypothetical protein
MNRVIVLLLLAFAGACFSDSIVSLVSPENGNVTNQTTLNLTFFFSANGTEMSCSASFANGSLAGGPSTVQNYTNYSFQVGPLPVNSTYGWFVNCTSPADANDSNVSETRTFTITVVPPAAPNVTDTTAPIISILSPASGMSTTNASIIAAVIANGTGTPLSNLTIVLSGAANATYQYGNSSGPNTANCTQVAQENVSCLLALTLMPGAYALSANTTDGGNNSAIASASFTISNAANTSALAIAINAPANNSTITDLGVMLSWTATSNASSNITCNLTIDNVVNRANLNLTSGIAFSTNASGVLSYGAHNWFVTCSDGVNASTSMTRVFAIDFLNIALSSPANNTVYANAPAAGTNVSFTWTVADSIHQNGTCSLIIRGSTNRSGIAVTSGTAVTAYARYLFTPGNYSWSVACADPLGATATSLTYIFTVIGAIAPDNSSDNATNSTLSGSGSRMQTVNVAIGGRSCAFAIDRQISSSSSSSVLSFTIRNNGAAGCNMSLLNFTDTIPTSFAQVTQVGFDPAYARRNGAAVVFSFVNFAIGQTRTLTYTVPFYVLPARLNDFSAPSISAVLAQPPAQTQNTSNQTLGGQLNITGHEGENATVGDLNNTNVTNMTGIGEEEKPQEPNWLAAGFAAFMIGMVALVGVAIIAYFAVRRMKKKGI